MKRGILMMAAGIASGVVFGMAGVAGAALSGTTSDSFNYPAGALLGSNAGDGWGGPWALRGTTGVADGAVNAAGLVSPVTGLATSGGKVVANPATQIIQAIRPLAAPVGSASGDTTVWLSFLGQKTNAGTRTFGVGLYADATAAGLERVTIGVPSSQTAAGGIVTQTFPNWGIYSAGAAATFQNSGVPASTLIFGVVELVYSPGNATGTSVYFYVNPSLDTTPTHESASATLLNVNVDFAAIRLAAGHQTTSNSVVLTAVNADFDELRVGTSFAAVAPVPEPAAMGVVGVVGAALLSRRRR